MSDQQHTWRWDPVSGIGGLEFSSVGFSFSAGPEIEVSSCEWSGSSFRGSLPVGGPPKEKPLRVAHIGTTLVRGGIESWLKTVIKFSRRIRIDRCVVTSPQFVDQSVADELGVPLDVGQAQAVARAARECDVLLYWGPETLADWLVTERPKLCVMVAHSENGLTRRICQRTAHLADAVVAVSRRVQELVCPHPRTTVIPHGVDAARLAPFRSRREIRESLGFAANDFVLGFVGRFFPEKRPELLVNTLAALPKTFKGLWIGWGPMERQLMELANHSIPGRYAFRTASNDIGNYYHAMDALCVPSLEEGFGLVILEAMMSGVPVITTNVGCVPELIVPGSNGIVVDQTVCGFVEAARRLASQPAFKATLIARARATADEKGHGLAMVEKYEDLIDTLWRGKHRPADASSAR